MAKTKITSKDARWIWEAGDLIIEDPDPEEDTAKGRGNKGLVNGKSPVYNEGEQELSSTFKSRVDITKVNTEKREVFGWALIAFDESGAVVPQEFLDENGQVTDHQLDMVDEEDLEKMAYRFVMLYREGGEMHIKGGSAILIESVVFTKEKQEAMGLPEGALPIGWWIGFKVIDDDAWEGIKSGKYKAFSIEGTAIREEVEEQDG